MRSLHIIYLAFLHHRDYFAPAGFIPTLLFFTTGIISAGQIRLLLLKASLSDHSVKFPLIAVYFNVQVNEIIPFFQSARMLPLYFSTRFSAMDRPIP